MVITPSGKPYDTLSPEDMVLVNYRTLAWKGEIKPSSELKFHASIYLERKDINAVIHTHQPVHQQLPLHAGRCLLSLMIWPR